MEPSPNFDYAIKELSSLNIELRQKAANLKKKEKNFLQITEQWKEYIDNYLKSETIQMEDQIKILMNPMQNKINQLMSRLNAQRSLLATVSSLKMHVEELRVYNENKDNEIDNLKSQIKTLTQTNKSLNKKLEIQKWKQEKAAAEFAGQMQQMKKTPSSSSSSSSFRTNKKKISSSSSLSQSQTHSYRLIEGLLYCIKPEKLSINNYLSLPSLLPSLTYYLPHVFTQTKSFQIVFCKFLYYYIYYMNMKDKLNHMHVQKFLDTIFSSPTPLEDDKSPSIIVYCLMVCILSKDYTQLNTVLSIIQAKLIDNDYKDIFNKYNGINIIIPLITSNNKSVNHNILTIILLFAQEQVPTSSINNNNNNNTYKINQINISFYNIICSEQFFNICVEVYNSNSNKYTIDTEEVLALCLQRLSSSPLYLNKLKDELYLINSTKLRLKNLNGDISDFLKLNLQSFIENITNYQTIVKTKENEEKENEEEEINSSQSLLQSPNTSKSVEYVPYTPSRNIYPSPKPISPLPSTPSPTLEKVQSLLDTVRQMRTQMTPPRDESVKDIGKIEEDEEENDKSNIDVGIMNGETDPEDDDEEDNLE